MMSSSTSPIRRLTPTQKRAQENAIASPSRTGAGSGIASPSRKDGGGSMVDETGCPSDSPATSADGKKKSPRSSAASSSSAATSSSTNRINARSVFFGTFIVTLVLTLGLVLLWSCTVPKIMDEPRQQTATKHNKSSLSHSNAFGPHVHPSLTTTADSSATITETSAPSSIQQRTIDPHSNSHLHTSQETAKLVHRRMIEQQLFTMKHTQSSSSDSDHDKSKKNIVLVDGVIADHLFLRSAPRVRSHHTSSENVTHQVQHQVEMNVAASTPHASSTLPSSASSSPHARPFIVHCKTPITSTFRTTFKSGLTATGYHLERYIPIGNFLLLPQHDAQHGKEANETRLFQYLQRMKPQVIMWHEYEKQDKIEPRLFSHCSSPSTLLHDLQYEHDEEDLNSIDLTVTLFHTASSASSPVPRQLVEWTHELEQRGGVWTSIRLNQESQNMIEVIVPKGFLMNVEKGGVHHTSSASHPISLCSLLTLLSTSSHTEYIEISSSFSTHNRYASPLIQTGTYSRPSILHTHGLTGKGQVITVADTGVAYGHCFFNDSSIPAPVGRVDFRHRKIVSYMPTRGKKYDMPSGHGTHTAASIAGHIDRQRLNDPTLSEEDRSTLRNLAQYEGVAYDAKLAVFDVNDGLSAGKIKPPKDLYTDYYSLAYNTMQARISSNSWGSKNGTYITECRETDRFVWIIKTSYQFFHQGIMSVWKRRAIKLCPVFSCAQYPTSPPPPSSQGERGYQSVVSPGTSKNCLTIGAIGNVKIREGVTGAFFCPASGAGAYQERSSSPGWRGGGVSDVGDHVSDVKDNAAFVDESIYLRRLYSFISGSGPTYDARLKPEVLAPGHYVISARSAGDPDLDQCRTCDQSLMTLFGTSMSAAVAAGSAALVRQYFTDGYYPSGATQPYDAFIPSAALLKATIIASAIPDTVESSMSSEASFSELNPFLPISSAIPTQTGPTPKSGYGRIQLDSVLRLTGAGNAGASAGTIGGQDNAAIDLYVQDGRKIETGEFHAFCFRVKDVPQKKRLPDIPPSLMQSSTSSSSSSSTSPSSSASSSLFSAPSTLMPFRASLVWSDPPSTLSTSWLLINDLDLSLEVTPPPSSTSSNTGVSNSSIYLGNQHWTDTSPIFDTTNNAELVFLPSNLLTSGALISVHIRGSHIPQGPQPYALVVSGSFVHEPTQTCSNVHSTTSICPRFCSHRGVCSNDGTCQCQVGFAGVACELQSTAITSCREKEEEVNYMKWMYYHYDVAPTTSSASSSAAPSLRILMHSLIGQPDLYVSYGRLPSLQDHDFAHLIVPSDDAASATATKASLTSQVDIPAAQIGRYYIGVYGYCCTATSRFAIQVLACEQSTANNIMLPPSQQQMMVPVAQRECSCTA